MPRTRSNRPQNRRLDALIALPLARFRTAVAALSPEELTALVQRIELKIVEQRWTLGGHGLARHRAPQELALLSRRLDETRIGQAESSSMRCRRNSGWWRPFQTRPRFNVARSPDTNMIAQVLR